MVLVNGAQGYRVCLECHAVLEGGDEDAWLAVHLQPHEGESRGWWPRQLSSAVEAFGGHRRER